MNFASIGKLISAWASIKDVDISDVSPTAILNLAGGLGHALEHSDAQTISLLCSQQDAGQTVGEFVSSGGLLRAVSAVTGQSKAVDTSLKPVTRCPFCNELHT